MSSASMGRNREYAVRVHMTAIGGWRQVLRAAGSKGSADLLMAHPEHGAALVQVGSRTKTLGPAERARLLADADDCGALALLAIVIPRRGIQYWTVSYGPHTTWQPWTPVYPGGAP